MIHSDKKSGQALVETALVLLLLLIILLGITEFARAWFVKNTLKHGAREGARKAVVTPDISNFVASCASQFDTCPNAEPAEANDKVLFAVCCSAPGIKRDKTQVTLSITDNGNSLIPDKGDTVEVTSSFNDSSFFIVGGSPWPWPSNLIFDVTARMRYE